MRQEESNMRDYHVHTTYSPDGNATLREQFAAAQSLGLSEICITDHLDLNYCDPAFDKVIDYDSYFAEIDSLRAEFPNLVIRRGIEAGEHAGSTQETLAVIKAHDFDYVLLSQHMIDGLDPYYYDEFLNGRTPAQAYRAYAEQVWASINRVDDYDCLAHLGYCSKFAPKRADLRPFDRAYAPDIVDAILKKLAQDGKALEINTSGLKNGGTSTIPGPDIVRRFIDLGGEFIMFGSDAHYTEYVAYEFDYARRMALECGAKYTLTFERRKGTPIKIEE